MTRREVRKLLKRLRVNRPPRRATRWHVMAFVGAALLAGVLLVVCWRHQAGPVPLPHRSASEMARQRAELAQDLYQRLTPLQRASLDRLEPVQIGNAGFTPEQRRRAWRLAQVGGAQFPLQRTTRITAVLQRMPAPDGAAPGDQVRCLVRLEFESQDSAVAYRAIVGAPGQ